MSGPNELAELIEAGLPDLIAARDAHPQGSREWKRANKLVKSNRAMLQWCKTRAGYVQPSKETPPA